jgi:hypothetical protein
LHTGIEKNMESKTYEKAEVMSDRIDYLNNLGNNLVYCMAIEKLVDLDVPVRAQGIRVILRSWNAFPLTWSGWGPTRSIWQQCRSSFTASANERKSWISKSWSAGSV